MEKKIFKMAEDIAAEFGLTSDDLILDGVYDWDLYQKAPVKILVAMKEAWDETDENSQPTGGGWNITECFDKPDAWKNRSWQPLIYLTYALFNGLRYEDMDYIRDDRSMVDVLKQISYTNISKLPGRKQSSDKDLTIAYNIWHPVLFNKLKRMHRK